jgi:lipopolysaccharide transport system ATP-binding protein
MRADLAIQAAGVGKQYQLGRLQGSYDLLSERLASLLKRDGTPRRRERFWALQDVDFELAHGETLGILGRNGAGKSTLLKILSRVTPPTRGLVRMRGRVGALLEVGTGFNLELTGRENVFLNGAILGMRRAEIQRKFDDIVEFAEVERFIDTPVKRYSSGMYLRLAFSVAAHLEPEILIVDEVLAVGDASFQKKCLGKMGEVTREGRTVVFVSHNTGAVENLCRSALVLEQGRVVFNGDVKEGIRVYMTEVLSGVTSVSLREREDRAGTGAVRLTGFRVEDEDGKPAVGAQTGKTCSLVFEYECAGGKPQRNVVASFAIGTATGAPLILHRTNFTNEDFELVPPEGTIRCTIPRLPLVPGTYVLATSVEAGGELADHLTVAAQLDVEPGDFFGTGHTGLAGHSPLLIEGSWSVSDSR